MREWTRAVAIVVAVVESRVCRMRRRSRIWRWRGIKYVWRKQCRVKYETEIFGRQAGHHGFGGREGERLKIIYGRREIFSNKRYDELCVIGILDVRDRRSADERAKRSGIMIEKKWAENRALWNSACKRDDGKLCLGIPTVDVRGERYEVNHCSETEEFLNQVERRWSRMKWSRVSKAADRSSRQRQDTCCMDMAL